MSRMAMFSGSSSAFVPNCTYTDHFVVGRGSQRVELYYFGRGHTAGDTWVVFPDEGVLQTGEVFPWKGAMLCDKESGGDCLAFPATLAAGVAALKRMDVVIPAHWPLVGWHDLKEYARFNTDLISSMRREYRRGSSTEDAVNVALGIIDQFPGYEIHRLKAAARDIYEELRSREAV